MKRSFKKVFILDTNILLNDAKIINHFSESGENLIVLPETVIDELDSKKTLMTEIGYQARSFGRILQNAVISKKISVGKGKSVSIVETKVQDIIIHIISFKDYELDNVFDKSVLNDRKIIKVASFASTYYDNKENTFLISEDIMCRTRAISLGVNTQGISKKEDIDYDFIKTIECSSELFTTLPGKEIISIDPDYVPSKYCYIFNDSIKGWKTFGYIKQGKINIIDENELRKGDIKPLNVGQIFAMAGLLEDFDISLIEAKSGSGKNVLAISAAMRLIDTGKFERIIYIRNSIVSAEKNAEIGFLPGSQTEKMKIFNHPLYDTISFIATETLKKKENKNKLSKEALEERVEYMIGRYQIEPQWVGELRGRTLSNAIVILDEAQNLSISSLNTIMTRIGKNSKVIAIGSNTQIDNVYLSVNSNGLTKLLSLANKEYENIEIFATNLQKSVRGPIVEFAEEFII